MPRALSSAPPDPHRRRLLQLGALVLAMPLALHAQAEVIPMRAADLRIEEGELLLSAQFDLTLTPPLTEALTRGIPLYFTVDFELTRPRWYWLDEKVVQWSISYRVSYIELTRQYRVSSGPLGQAFDSLEEVQRFVGRVSSRPVGSADTLAKGARYEAALRMRLDVAQLPKPFQVSALTSDDWPLGSDGHRWSFTP
jgi:hypothetical protein